MNRLYRRGSSAQEAPLSEKFMEKVFIPHYIVEVEYKRRLSFSIVNRFIPDPISPEKKQPFVAP